MVLAIAIFNSKNVLLYLRVKEKDMHREQEICTFLYCSYDIVAEKVRLSQNKATQENYLGPLLLNNTFRSFGYLTNGGIKFLLVVDVENNLVLKDQDIRVIFKRLHSKYCDAISNPFHKLGSPLSSRHIDSVVAEVFEL